MKEFLFEATKKAIVIVAHPDDETIWMGGCILKHPELDWTIFSLCRSSDRDREPKFRQVCKRFGAKSIMRDMDDDGNLDPEEAREVASQLIEAEISGMDFTYLFTHAKNGEYGHIGHIATHEAVNNLISKKIIRPEAVFYFNYKKNRKSELPLIVPANCSDIKIELDAETFTEKKRIVAEMYGYPYDGIDVGYCTNPEVFKLRLQIHK